MPRKNYPTSFIFNLLMLIFIALIPIYWISNIGRPPQRSYLEGRKLSLFPKLIVTNPSPTNPSSSSIIASFSLKDTLRQFKQEIFQKRFQKACADQFPLRESIINFSKSLDRTLVKLAYLIVEDEYIPADMQRDIYISRDGSTFIKKPSKFDKLTRDQIDQRIENYKYLINKYPDLSITAFYINTIAESKINPLNKFFPTADNGNSFEYFLSTKPDRILVDSYNASSIDELYNDFYRTDHHWNQNGYLKAYYKIHNLLKHNYPNISPPLSPIRIDLQTNVHFYGSYARLTFYPVDPDQFYLPIFNLSPRKILINGFISENKVASKEPNSKYQNYYQYYYGRNDAIREYIVENNTDRNLLIIGSSYAKPIVPLLADHYSHTYFIDLRSNTDFSFKKFVKAHPITDLLIVGDANVVYSGTKYWMIHK